MRVIVADPPLLELYDPGGQWPAFLEEILRGLREKKPIIYAWGDTLYNPRGVMIPPELMVHEEVHLKQQAGDPKAWWLRYIDDPQFRLVQELPAHRAEYANLKATLKDRNQLTVALHRLALRLASPLYGSLIDFEQAREGIAGDEMMPGYRETAQQQRQRFRPTAE